MTELIKIDEQIGLLLDLQDISNIRNLGIDVFDMYQALYQDHKSKNGSYKHK